MLSQAAVQQPQGKISHELIYLQPICQPYVQSRHLTLHLILMWSKCAHSMRKSKNCHKHISPPMQSTPVSSIWQ